MLSLLNVIFDIYVIVVQPMLHSIVYGHKIHMACLITLVTILSRWLLGNFHQDAYLLHLDSQY